MSLTNIPPDCRVDAHFTQYATGYYVYGVKDDFTVKDEFQATDGEHLCLRLGDGTSITIETVADFNEAVARLSALGWEDDQIIKVFTEVGIDRDSLEVDE